MSKIKNKKRLSTVAVAFAIIFVAGVVYAATAGALTFQGTVTIDPNANLVLSSSDSSVSISSDGQTATFTIEFADASDTVSVPMKVANEGNVDALIAGAVRGAGGSAGVEYSGHEILFDETIPVGGDEDFDLEFSLNQADAEVMAGLTAFTFTFMLDYDIVP